MRRVLAVAALLLASQAWGQSSADQTLTKGSPLATDGDRLFGILSDGRTIAARPLAGGPWQPVPLRADLEQPSGLAVADGRLYAADARRRTVTAIQLSDGRSVVVAGPDGLQQPGMLAMADGPPQGGVRVLYLVDGGAGRIVRLWVDGDHAKYAPLEVAPRVGERATVASFREALVIADPDLDLLLRISNAPYEAWLSETLQVGSDSDDRKRVSNPRDVYQGKRGTEGSDEYPRIDRPRAVATRQGIVYAVSEATRDVYSTPRWERRPVRSSFETPHVRDPAQILVTDDSMFVLDDATGDVVRWPRPVPAEFTFEVDAASECMARFYAYLRERGALPTREVPIRRSLEQTLREERVLRSPWVSAFDDLMCSLNESRSLCTNGRPNAKIPADAKILIPDLLVEGTLVNRRTAVEGDTVQAIVKRSVRSPDFDYATKPDYIEKYNRSAAKRAPDGDVMRVRSGDLVLPKELVRYVAAVPASDVRDGALGPALMALRDACPGTEINPLETRRAAPSSTPIPAAAAPVDAYEQVVKEVVRFDPTWTKTLQHDTRTKAPFVAIVEDRIDVTHPDFFDQSGGSAFVRDPAPVPAAEPCCTSRPEAVDDHGTAVAYLVGGRRRRTQPDQVAGLAPMARLVDFEQELSSLPRRFGQHQFSQEVRVVNLSLRTPKLSRDPALQKLLNDNAQILFVVAAGNNKREEENLELCTSVDVYPACEFTRPNVIVVGATVMNGTSMMAPTNTTEGSHWSGRAVHVAAPGVGFESAGNDEAYVPVRGTSFAAPLVTATAALLVAEGIDDPWAIKQRIIAAAEPINALNDKVLGGGLLNIDRTVRDVDAAVLTDENNEVTAVRIVPDGPDLPMLFVNKRRKMPIANVLRLTRVGAGPEWRLVYRSVESDEVLVRHVRADGDWNFSYLARNGGGATKHGKLDDYIDYLAAAQ